VLLELANIGYQVGAVGIIVFTFSFLVVIRWWTDHLGRVIAGVLAAMSAVLMITTARMLDPTLTDHTTYQMVRIGVFWVFGLGIWIALSSFVWAQFFAPRIRKSERMATRKEHNREEVDSPGTRDNRHGDPDRVSGGLG
jgi:hypothetical protein